MNELTHTQDGDTLTCLGCGQVIFTRSDYRGEIENNALTFTYWKHVKQCFSLKRILANARKEKQV